MAGTRPNTSATIPNETTPPSHNKSKKNIKSQKKINKYVSTN